MVLGAAGAGGGGAGVTVVDDDAADGADDDCADSEEAAASETAAMLWTRQRDTSALGSKVARPLAMSSVDQSAPPLQVTQAVGPYLSAALSVIETLERELRSAAPPGSREEISADALSMRATELRTQIARLEVEARSAALEAQLVPSGGRRTGSAPLRERVVKGPTAAAKPPMAERSARMAELQGKLAQAEKDAKAYKARLRHQEDGMARMGDMIDREADLERQLISAQGSSATHARDADELRHKVALLEAKCEAQREELERTRGGKHPQHGSETELLAQVNELQRKVQSVQLEKATWERKAEICEAELVDTLAKMYTLQGSAGVLPVRELNEAERTRLEECMRDALDASSTADAKHAGWSSSNWLESLGVSEAIGGAIFKRLRGGAPAERVWLERQFVSCLASKGGYSLVRALLLEANLADELATKVWNGVVELAAGGDAGGGGYPAPEPEVWVRPASTMTRPTSTIAGGMAGLAMSASLSAPPGAQSEPQRPYSQQQYREPHDIYAEEQLRAARDAEERAASSRQGSRQGTASERSGASASSSMRGLQPIPKSLHHVPTDEPSWQPGMQRPGAYEGFAPIDEEQVLGAEVRRGGAKQRLEFSGEQELQQGRMPPPRPTYSQRPPVPVDTPAFEDYSDVGSLHGSLGASLRRS